MPSIRRSLTLYLLVLLAITLVVVWAVIDQVTARALIAREAEIAGLVTSRHQDRVREELARTDEALLQQAKELGNIMQSHYYSRFTIEMGKYRMLQETAPLLFLSNPFSQAAWIASAKNSGTFSKPNPIPSALFRMYFANLPLPEEYIQLIDEENRGNDYFQINTLSGREWHSRSLEKQGNLKLPFDAKQIDTKPVELRTASDGSRTRETSNLIDWIIGDTLLSDGKQPIRRVLMKVPYFDRNLQFPGGRSGGGRSGGGPPDRGGFGPPSRSVLGSWVTWVGSELTGPPPGGVWPPPSQPIPPPAPTADALPRLYIQCARPLAVIDDLIARLAAERDDELTRLSEQTRQVRRALQLQVGGIGILAFLAIALGGPILVNRGLRPLGKLSDAVSRVSEKDFKLPHDGHGLSDELLPIHSRLTQTLELLQRAFSREKQAVADISHELRTPIAALMATIEVALRKPRSPDQYRTTLEECRLISKELSQLVERIMTLASLDAGNDHTQITLVDAADLAVSCAAVIRPLGAAHTLTVHVHANGPLDVETDSGKLREVIMNLLHNAVEYNKPDGTIDLTARRDGRSIVLEVRDTGIGMTQEVKDKIFERFYRADPSRHSTGVHAGLGLAIVQEYVERLNGTITVESELGAGSIFRVKIPGLEATSEFSHWPEDHPAIVGR